MALPSGTVTSETLITLKVSYNDALKKIKLPLKDLSAAVLPDKLRNALNIPADKSVTFERYSDSAGGFIVLEKSDVPVYKALLRAAKAKGKLRLRVAVAEEKKIPVEKMSGTLAAAQDEWDRMVAAKTQRDFTCVKPRMTGTGIFEYRAAQHASQQTLVNEEAPVPAPFVEENKAAEPVSPARSLALRTRSATAGPALSQAAWSVFCNVCDVAMSDVHYHCSTCDGGDYDLCESCVAGGQLCPGEDHWLIKRFIRDGKVVTSVTERVGRKYQKEAPEVKEMPGGFTEDKPIETQLPQPTRTCNSCVVVLPEREFVTCNDCEDFDLCIACHIKNQHGHSAKHSFSPTSTETVLPVMAQFLLKAGRNVAHRATCDNCNKKIFGVRHKCLNCPDWDYCSDCFANAAKLHPRHRFAPVYEQLSDPCHNLSRHFGIYCDGPACRSQKCQTYIVGDRYKCAVCHDTDFCANCEALPTNIHNRTHPLIKFRTPVRGVSITTSNEDNLGNVRNMGDRHAPAPPAPAEPAVVNTATAVQTVAEIPPTQEKVDHIGQPKDGDVSLINTAPTVVADIKSAATSAALLNATFVRDSVPDGTTMAPGVTFTQVWTLRNEGPFVWPAGCSVRYVGGDNMLNVDNFRPASVSDIAKATESSVVAREVQVGEEISFRIALRAPLRQGKSISYWRLKSADGTPFGHRLWCDIEVRGSPMPYTTSDKVINAPTEPTFVPPMTMRHPHDLTDRAHQSRISTMHAQLRLLQNQNQQQLWDTQVQNGNYRAVSMPMPAMPAFTLPTETSIVESPFNLKAADVVRKEAAKARVEAIKAKILRYRAENHKVHADMKRNMIMPAHVEAQIAHAEALAKAGESAVSAMTTASKSAIAKAQLAYDEALAKAGQSAVPAMTTASKINVAIKVEEPAIKVEEKPDVSELIKVEEKPDLATSSTSSSQMIFPKLEKESPASSIIVAKPASVQSEDGHVEQSAAMSQAQEAAETDTVADDLDDVDVVSIGVSSEDEDDGFLTDEEYDILDASDRETVTSP